MYIFYLLPGVISLFFIHEISKIINLYDIPKTSRKKKLQKRPISLIIGLVLLLNISSFLIINFFFETITKLNLIILILINLSYFLGYFDDLKNLNPLTKTIIVFFILILLVPLESNLILHEMRFKNLFENTISLKYLSIFITIFFIYIFLNFLNFADGANGIALSLSIFFISILIFERGYGTDLEILTLITLIICLFVNLKNISFLGNSGVFLLGTLIPIFYIKDYNTVRTFFCDEIFLIFFIPGTDMTRLVIERSVKRTSIARADFNHLHHYIIKSFGEKKCFIYYLAISIIPFFLSKFYSDFKILIPFCFLFYLIILFFFKRGIKNFYS
jgi:UDP-GlcNAc:undecaprenyl-phosphate GlcNAc-1-phosphate transferase